MASNPYLHRSGERAFSEITIRNTYHNNYGIQHYLIVEGISDEHFFENILDCKKCKVVQAGDKDEVIKFIKSQNAKHEKGYIGVVDADFEHILGEKETIDNLIRTETHDLEMLMFKSNLDMRRIYSEMTDNIIINEYETAKEKSYIQSVMDAAYEIGILKLSIIRHKYDINMKDLPYVDVIDDNFRVDIDTLINRIRGRRTFYEIKKAFTEEIEKEYDLFQVCCGHDVTNILAISFMDGKDGLGYGHIKNLTNTKIEQLLRVIYNLDDFVSTEMYKELIAWEEKNSYEILDRARLKMNDCRVY